MSPSSTCLALIEKFEGCSLSAYWDALGNRWTIGYGHTGPDVQQGVTWTQGQCIAALEADAMHACSQVAGVVDVQLTQGQVDALTDFVYNLGIERLASSTLLRDLNARNYTAAAQQFLLWDYADGEPNDGLHERRAAEQQLFLAQDT